MIKKEKQPKKRIFSKIKKTREKKKKRQFIKKKGEGKQKKVSLEKGIKKTPKPKNEKEL